MVKAMLSFVIGWLIGAFSFALALVLCEEQSPGYLARQSEGLQTIIKG